MPDAQQQFRTDVLTGRHMILAAGRRQRPIQNAAIPQRQQCATAEYDPFAEGNEHDTPNERLALRKPDSSANRPGWLLRVVPNKFPAVDESPAAPTGNAQGIHDVVIECPDTRHHLTDLSVQEVARVFYAWQIRIRKIAADTRLRSTAVFRNEGRDAGASLSHCHSQILATEFHTGQQKQRIQQAQAFAKQSSGTLFTSWLTAELAAETRIVQSSDAFVTLCPWASRVDWHTRFVPDRAAPVFQELSQQHITELAQRVHSIATAVKKLRGQMDQNLVLILPPNSAPELFPWMLDFMPRQNRFAGFEMLTDTDIVTTAPETAAEQLRGSSISTTVDPSSDLAMQPDGYEWTS